jgi:hypothetical protein
MLGYVMDGKSDKAFSGLKRRIAAEGNALKLAAGSELVESGLSRAIAKSIANTHLGETEHDLATHSLRLFHVVLPVDRSHEGVQI